MGKYISEIGEEESKKLLYTRLFLQFYTWKKSAEFIESIHSKTPFELLISLRPDVILSKNITEYYDFIKKNTIYFEHIPSYNYQLFKNCGAQEDKFFMGNTGTCLEVLKIIDFIDYLKINDVCVYDNKIYEYKDSFHPETVLYSHCMMLDINQENIEDLFISIIR